jgi:hypothetical protein
VNFEINKSHVMAVKKNSFGQLQGQHIVQGAPGSGCTTGALQPNQHAGNFVTGALLQAWHLIQDAYQQLTQGVSR